MVRTIKTLNDYERAELKKHLEAISSRVLTASTSFAKADEVGLELALNIISDRVKYIREILYT